MGQKNLLANLHEFLKLPFLVAVGDRLARIRILPWRVSEVGENTSRILLVTDLNSRIPVRLEAGRDNGMLAGDNTDRPSLIYMPPTARMVVGDRIVTSGDGAVFPPGLAVGTVLAAEDGVIRVQPLVNWNRLEYVRIIDLDPTGIVGRRSRRSAIRVE